MGNRQKSALSSSHGIRARDPVSLDSLDTVACEESIHLRERKFTPEETVFKAITDARDWMMAQLPTIPRLLKPLIRFEPNPNLGNHCAIYTDAAWNPSTGCAGLGWIVDDQDSSTQHAATSTSVGSPLMAENLAVLAAMTFVRDHEIDSISLFSDSQTLIKTLIRRERKLEIYGVISDIYILSASFKSILFNFIPRAANDRANSVAKQVLWVLNLA